VVKCCKNLLEKDVKVGCDADLTARESAREVLEPGVAEATHGVDVRVTLHEVAQPQVRASV
jgi:hypothetical protein